MAKKALFHQLHARTVHEEFVLIVPEASANHAKLQIESSEVVVDHVECKGWHMVEVLASPDGTVFDVKIKRDSYRFFAGQPGYEYLKRQFPERYYNCEKSYQ